MIRKQLGVVVGVATLILVFGGPAIAKAPAPIVVAHSAVVGTPQMFIDSKGTENMVWGSLSASDSMGERLFAVRYARKPKGAKHFTQVKLPPIFDPEDPLIYQVSPGVLQILAYGAASKTSTSEGTFAWRSTNDGKSWTVMDTSALNVPSLRAGGVYINEMNMTVVAGGPVTATGASGGGPVIQLKSNLTGWTKIATVGDTILGLPKFAESLSGKLYMVTNGGIASTVPFQVGNNTTGQVTFPSCAGGSIETRLAAGRSVAVVAGAGCGHVWVRTISPGGKVGRLVRIGSVTGSGETGMSVVADRAGHFTVAWVEPGNDLGTARSSSGSHWKTSRGSVPIANLGGDGSLSVGKVTWYSFARGYNDNTGYPTKVETIPLSDTYRPPKPPSAHGISHPHRGHIGSLAVVVPGKIGLKGFRKNGHITVRLVDALAERIQVEVGDSRVKGDTTYDICDGGRVVKLAAHRVKTITLSCQASGGIVLDRPRTSEARIDAHKGDTVSFSFSGRNGAVSLTSKVK